MGGSHFFFHPLLNIRDGNLFLTHHDSFKPTESRFSRHSLTDVLQKAFSMTKSHSCHSRAAVGIINADNVED